MKPENIFLKNNSKQLFIGDFGVATRIDNKLVTTTTGTMKYIAPEIMTTQQGYDEKADLWSLGKFIKFQFKFLKTQSKSKRLFIF